MIKRGTLKPTLLQFLVSFLLIFMTCWELSFAGTLMVRLGPPALGNGGPNPVSIPPTSLAEYEFTYVTNAKSEWNLAISPGLFYGWRNELKSGAYVSFGPGVVIDANGSSLGAYSAFGYNITCKSVCFSIEYKQALGFSHAGLLCPYAVRMGFGYNF